MARNLSASVISAITSDKIRPRVLAYFNFPSGAVRLWTGVGDLVWNSNTYTGVGTLGSVRPARGGTDLRSDGVEFSLSGVPSSLISAALGDAYQGQDCSWWLAFMDASDAVIATPYQWKGYLDTMTIHEAGDKNEIRVTAESRMIDLDRPRERRYTDEDLQSEYAGDLGLEFAASLVDLPIYWGSAAQGRTVPTRLPNPKSAA